MNDAHPLIKVAAGGGEQIVAWTFERPNGGAALGPLSATSTKSGAWNPSAPCDQWNPLVARLEVPATGAPVAVTDEDLTLPPDPREPPQAGK